MPHRPTDTPGKYDPEWLREELESFTRSHLEGHDFYMLNELHVAPVRPRLGMLVLADGTNWNPGSGAGFYGYYGGSWVKLG